MSDLEELARSLTAAQLSRSPTKIYFYGTEQGQLRTGFVNIYDGVSCDLHLLSLPADRAIAALRSLKVNRVMAMPLPASQASTTPTCFPLTTLLSALRGVTGGSQSQSSVPAPAPIDPVNPTDLDGLIGDNMPPSVLTFADATRLIDATRSCCAAYLGSQVDKKIKDAAALHPPQLRPEAFLKVMQAQLATMLGPAGATKQLARVAEQFALSLT